MNARETAGLEFRSAVSANSLKIAVADERWAQISRIYNDAPALAPGDRAAFLRNTCDDDEGCGPRSNRCSSMTAVRRRYSIEGLAHNPVGS